MVVQALNSSITLFKSVAEQAQQHYRITALVTGGLGGWMVGVGPKLGGFQALTSILEHNYAIKPIVKYINPRIGENKTISDRTADILAYALIIMEITGPVFMTLYLGPPSMQTLDAFVPALFQPLWGGGSSADYTFFRGLLCSLAPVAIQLYTEKKLREQADAPR